MQNQLTPSLQALPRAFPTPVRQAQSYTELFDRCREILVQRVESEGIWFSISQNGVGSRRVGGGEGFGSAVEVGRCSTGGTELLILATPAIATRLRPVAMPMA